MSILSSTHDAFPSDALINSAVHGVPAPRRLSRRELVARTTTLVRDHLGDPMTVAELSRVIGVSERTLRAAFHDVIGISPKRYALRQRLNAAHQALRHANPHSTTVTDVAMTFGFFELGRFAGRYRHTFGEAPSRTLRHALRESTARLIEKRPVVEEQEHVHDF